MFSKDFHAFLSAFSVFFLSIKYERKRKLKATMYMKIVNIFENPFSKLLPCRALSQSPLSLQGHNCLPSIPEEGYYQQQAGQTLSPMVNNNSTPFNYRFALK